MRTAHCYQFFLSVCLSVCLLEITMSCVKTAELTDMPFGLWTRVSTGKHGLGGSPDPTGDGGNFYPGQLTTTTPV